MAYEFIRRFLWRRMAIWFILGPSGVGKTCFCEYLSNQYNWFHLNLDEPFLPNGIDKFGFRKEWDQFFFNLKGRPLSTKIMKKFASLTHSGIVVSFPSDYVLSADHIHAINGHVKIIYLYGSPQSCLTSFLERERLTGRQLREEHWEYHNCKIYEALNTPELWPWTISAFYQKDGSRKSFLIIYNEIASID